MSQENTQPAETIAKLLMITVRRLQQLHQEGWIPKHERGRWPLVGAVQGYIRFLRDRHVGDDLESKINPQYERALLSREQRAKVIIETQKLEIETQVLRGNLLTAEEVETAWTAMIGAFRARMLGVPGRAAQSVIATTDISEAEQIIRTLVYEALSELADYDPEHYRTHSRKSNGTSSATPEPDSKPVGRRRAPPKQRSQRRAGPVEH